MTHAKLKGETAMMRALRVRLKEIGGTSFLIAGHSAAPFTPEEVALAPAAPGVYFLYRNERLIYIGIAVHGSGIRQELERHLRGIYGTGTRAATSFDYELTRDPVVVSAQYLQAHMARHGGRLPSFNALER
jgi:hypothetical protein